MDKNWNKNKLVGNSAENIIEFLIKSMPEWTCIEFGVESHTKDIKNMAGEIVNPVTTKIRRMPDFVVFNEKARETFFVEVKYSTNSEGQGYLFKYLESYNEYWGGTKLIIVRQNKPHFVWIDLKKIDNSMMKMKKINGEWAESWEFGELEQDIKTLFPDLKDEDIDEAIKRIAPK